MPQSAESAEKAIQLHPRKSYRSSTAIKHASAKHCPDVLADTKFVVNLAKHVAIDHEALREFVNSRCDESLAVPEWEERYHYRNGVEKMVAYFLVLASMNFSSGEPKAWCYELENERLDGYFAVSAALMNAFQSGIPLHDAGFLKRISENDFDRIFDGQGDLTFRDRRLEMLRELGRGLELRFEGKAINLVSAAKSSAVRLLALLLQNFPSFIDSAVYHDREVGFHKRAQIFIGDLFGAFAGVDTGCFEDIDKLTAFADDSLPFVLRHHGILRYSPHLASSVDNGVPLEHGSVEEVEIRASTIQAVEKIRVELAKSGFNLNSVELDWVLWNRSYEIETGRRHRTWSTAY